MKLLAYTDYAYHRDGGTIYAERAFAIFLSRLAERLDGIKVAGRLAPDPRGGRYALPDEVEFVPLQHYESLANPLPALRAMIGSLRRIWSALDGVDAVWLLGPHPLAIVAVPLARLRGASVILGVRQDTPNYVRMRRPGRPGLLLAARAMDACYRALARRCPTVVVGPDLAARYARAPRLLEIAVSLVSRRQVVSASGSVDRSYDATLTLLSVGRLDPEKNPLMLVDVLERLRALDHGRWRLVVCGEGSEEEALRVALEARGLAGAAELRGYVPFEELQQVYRRAHLLLSTSWTEGLPQVMVEACAATLPIVSTDVGGIGRSLGEAALLVPPADVTAAADAALRVARTPELRERMATAGRRFALAHTTEGEIERLSRFLAASSAPSSS